MKILSCGPGDYRVVEVKIYDSDLGSTESIPAVPA
jgi:hypothetical protein